jgi:LPXTG-motif cell wall-anchored protein
VGEPKGTSPYLIGAIAVIAVGAGVFFLRGRKSTTAGAA